MNDTLEILFQELTDTLEDSLPSAYWKHRRLRGRREDALLETLDQRQRQLPEDYQESEWDCTEQRERAVFLAAFQLAPALRQASSSAFLAVFFAAGFFAAGFLAVVVFFAAVFFAGAFLAAVFFAAGFFVAVSAADCSAASSAAPSVLSWAGLRG